MNILIVANKADLKTYKAVANSVRNISVIGSVSMVNADFLNLIGEKYNPHAILIDTDAAAKKIDIRNIINNIAVQYPYIKTLVLTTEDDSFPYTACRIVRGVISSIEIKKILEGMVEIKEYNAAEPNEMNDPDGSAVTEKLSQREFHAQMDNLSAQYKINYNYKKPKRKSLMRRAIIIGAISAAALILLTILILFLKSSETVPPSTATPDEAATTAAPVTTTSELDVSLPATIDSVDILSIADYTSYPLTEPVLPTINNSDRSVVLSSKTSEKKPKAASSSGGASSSGASPVRSSDGGSTGSAGGGSQSISAGGSPQQSQNSDQVTTQIIAGEPSVEYGRGRYENSGGNQVESIKLSYSSKTLFPGESIRLTVTVTPSAADSSVRWATSNSRIVTVSSDGTIKAVSTGSAEISAVSSNGKKAVCSVTVKEKNDGVDVRLSAASYRLLIGKQTTVTLIGASSVKWTLNNNNVKIVSVAGNEAVIEGVKAGTARLTARDLSTNKTYSCTVNVV